MRDRRTVTRKEIVEAIERLESMVRDWEATADQSLLRAFRGRNVLTMSLAVEEAARELFELCDTMDVERDAWPLVLAVDRFDDAMAEFIERQKRAPYDTDPSGGRLVWGPFEQLQAAKTPWRAHKLEPIPQLLAERVPRAQIAKMYGWYRPDGTPDLDKLQKEIEEPGTFHNPETYVSPRDRKYWAGVEQQWAKRTAAFEAAKAAPQKKERKPAPEPLDELIMQGVNAEQIAKMKMISVDEVRARAAELGIALDSASVANSRYWDAQRAMAGRRQAQLQAAMTINTYPEFGDDREKRIVAMSEDGLKPGQIAEALRPVWPTLTAQGVGQFLARIRKSEPIAPPTEPPDTEDASLVARL